MRKEAANLSPWLAGNSVEASLKAAALAQRRPVEQAVVVVVVVCSSPSRLMSEVVANIVASGGANIDRTEGQDETG